MANLGAEIRRILSGSASGMSARSIADSICTTRKRVNSYLYSHMDEFEKDDSYIPLWTVRGFSAESDFVMAKLQNRSGARVFSQEDFDELADWEYGTAFVGKYRYETQSGNIIECDSKSEIMLLVYLEENDLVKDIGGQMLEISYESAFRAGLSYFPDIVALTSDNHIAIFEVKAATAMDNHSNMEKYSALAEFCEERGYMYVMIDPVTDFITFEEIRDMDVCTELYEMFEEWEDEPVTPQNPYMFFDGDDVREWYESFGEGFTKREFYLQVHSMVMRYDWYNLYKNGFMVYSRPVMVGDDHEVIDYL